MGEDSCMVVFLLVLAAAAPTQDITLLQTGVVLGSSSNFFVFDKDILSPSVKNQTGAYGGVAIIDVDGDGKFEYFLNGQHCPDRLLKFSHDHLIDVAPYFGLRGNSVLQKLGLSAVSCDVDGDGLEEIFAANIVNGSSSDRLFHRSHQIPTFSNVLNVKSSYKTSAVSCYTNLESHSSDLAIGEIGGGLRYFSPSRNYDTHLVAPLPETENHDVLTTFRAILVAPLASHTSPLPSSALDMFLVNANGPNHFLVFSGSHQQNGGAQPDFSVNRFPLHINNAREYGRTVGLIDFNEDGLMDILLGNSEPDQIPPQSHHLFLNQGNGTFKEESFEALQNHWGHIRTFVVADFDNDGLEEIFIQNSGQGQSNTLLTRSIQSDGSVQWEAADVESSPYGTSAVASDVNGDGILELLIVDGGNVPTRTSSISVHRPAEASPHYLRVAPFTPSGSPARGTLVTVKHKNGKIQSRIIDAGGMSLSQQEPVAHFGLGDGTNVITLLTVTWPDGASASFVNPSPDQTLSVPYPFVSDPNVLVRRSPYDCQQSQFVSKSVPCDTIGSFCSMGLVFSRDESGRCFCRTGYPLRSCPQANSTHTCSFAFHLANQNDVCVCQVDDSANCNFVPAPAPVPEPTSLPQETTLSTPPDTPVPPPTQTGSEIPQSVLIQFNDCLHNNLVGPMRCVVWMESLGYGQSVQVATPVPTPHPGENTEVQEVTCPSPSAEKGFCAEGHRLRREVVEGESKCFCEREHLEPFFRISPCPDTSHITVTDLTQLCPIGYHFEHNTIADVQMCLCVRQQVILESCPVLSSDQACDNGYSFSRESHGHGHDVCSCDRIGWQIPCVSCDGACPASYRFKKEDTQGSKCFCISEVHAEEEDEEEPSIWKNTCEHCYYGYGECGYHVKRGWYCKCTDPDYDGPDCLTDTKRLHRARSHVAVTK